mmetsp:Transcript_46430/g.82985  ORF Transcript_46430/g.82985 Transcript_46430/m.82985 type:complete len:87 (+) Transcript_46430:126-386(+)
MQGSLQRTMNEMMSNLVNDPKNSRLRTLKRILMKFLKSNRGRKRMNNMKDNKVETLQSILKMPIRGSQVVNLMRLVTSNLKSILRR